MIRNRFKFLLYLSLLIVTSCISAPRDTSNTCLMFTDNYFWYKFVKNSEKKWGAPVELQMAIIQRESDFDQSGINYLKLFPIKENLVHLDIRKQLIKLGSNLKWKLINPLHLE
ncbi:MAG: hypothetical protein RL327_662 [Pseudomonadota bacterium]